MEITNYWILKKKVLPQDTDHAGIMWHGNYLKWLEEARIEALNNAGIDYLDLIKEGLEMPVISVNIKYKSPIFLGNEIEIRSNFKINKSPKLRIESNIFDEKNNHLTSAIVEIVLIRKDNFSIVRKRPHFLNEPFKKLIKG